MPHRRPCPLLSWPLRYPGAGAWFSGVNTGELALQSGAERQQSGAPLRAVPCEQAVQGTGSRSLTAHRCSACACSSCIASSTANRRSPLRYSFSGVITIHGAVVKTGEVVAWQIFKKGYK